MTEEQRSKEPPSVWLFTVLAAIASVTPLIDKALDEPITGEMNAMLFVAGVVFPAVSLLYLFGTPKIRDKMAVAMTCLFGGATLLWVDWGRIDGRVFVVAGLFLVPTLVRLISKRIRR